METSSVILADTCIVIWLSRDPEQLSTPAVRAIQQARQAGGIAISDVTLYEIAWLATQERIELVSSLDFVLSQIETNFVVLPVTAKVAQTAAALPEGLPGDPMDRLIAATALTRGMPLVTSDKAIRRSRVVPVIW